MISRQRMIGLILTGCVCAGIAVSGTLLGGNGMIPVYDGDGNEIAELFLEDGELQYQCEEKYQAYIDLVRNEVLDVVMEQEGKTREEVAARIISKGYNIRTGLSEKAVDGLRDAYENNPDAALGNTAAAVSDTRGLLIACYSSSAEGNSYNYVTVPAYAGSAIKPLSVYAPALESRTITWSSLYRDSPYALVENDEGQMVEWPVNTEPYTDQMITVEDAVAQSNNAVAVKVLRDSGVERACYFLEDAFGIQTGSEIETIEEKGEDRVLSNIALGYLEGGVTVEQMTGAYQVFANGGIYYEPHTVTEILDGDNVYYAAPEDGERVISAQTAYIMNRLMSGVVRVGTGTSAQIDGVDVCGKTGTSEYGDHWFAGITPEYVCVVWHEEGMAGGSTDSSVRVFRDAVEALEHFEDQEYPQAPGVEELTYCRASGMISGSHCQDIGTGYYSRDNTPGVCTECR